MLIDVEQATKLVLSHPAKLKTENIDLQLAVNRVLAENLYADRDFPPFNRVMMDGIAINSAHFRGKDSSIRLEAMQAAGDEPLKLKNQDCGIEIMTGAVLPSGCDVVIPYEQISIENRVATLDVESVRSFQNIHLQGQDKKKGDLLVPKSTVISPAEIGVAATIGKSTLEVISVPKIAILSTGDELVEIDEIPLAHQIRRSNVHTLRALAEKHIGPADIFHINDEAEALKVKVEALLANYDLILMSGGVSKGKFDLLPDTLAQLGVQKHFHGVKQRPGKPFWFGSKDDVQVFAFPGNPVSTFMCAMRYLLPWWKRSQGLESKMQYAILEEDYYFKPSLQYFLQVSLNYSQEGKTLAKPITGQGSGDLANLCEVDAFIELPEHRTDFKAGESFPVWIFR